MSGDREAFDELQNELTTMALQIGNALGIDISEIDLADCSTAFVTRINEIKKLLKAVAHLKLNERVMHIKVVTATQDLLDSLEPK